MQAGVNHTGHWASGHRLVDLASTDAMNGPVAVVEELTVKQCRLPTSVHLPPSIQPALFISLLLCVGSVPRAPVSTSSAVGGSGVACGVG